MRHRFVVSFGLAAMAAGMWLAAATVGAQAQTPAGAARKAGPAKKTTGKAYTVPRTPWGDPDIQGIWNNGTITPLERPNGVDKDILSEEEAGAVDSGESSRAEKRPDDKVRDLELAYNQEWWDRGKSIGRTSLVIDPSDGRLPPLTEEGKRRKAAYEADRRSRGPDDSVTDRPFPERCLIYRSVPPLPTGYNNNYHLFQTPGYIVILQEQIHDFRFIPLDGRPHLTGNIRQWVGDSRGHWEGDTLVIETTNFDPHIDFFKFQIASETLKVVERLTRTDADNIDYRWTVHDPTTYTKPWTAVLPLRSEKGPMFEYACHEGNRGLPNVLSGFRAQEKMAADAKKTQTKQ